LRHLADEFDALYPGPPVLGFPVVFLKGAPCMGAITVKDSDAPFSAAVTFVDAKGDATTPDDVPTWSTDNASAVGIVAAADGLSAEITPGSPGAAVVTVSTTDTDGNVVLSEGTVTVQPGEAVIGDVEFTK
jgi:hypothetical protein